MQKMIAEKGSIGNEQEWKMKRFQKVESKVS